MTTTAVNVTWRSAIGFIWWKRNERNWPNGTDIGEDSVRLCVRLILTFILFYLPGYFPSQNSDHPRVPDWGKLEKNGPDYSIRIKLNPLPVKTIGVHFDNSCQVKKLNLDRPVLTYVSQVPNSTARQSALIIYVYQYNFLTRLEFWEYLLPIPIFKYVSAISLFINVWQVYIYFSEYTSLMILNEFVCLFVCLFFYEIIRLFIQLKKCLKICNLLKKMNKNSEHINNKSKRRVVNACINSYCFIFLLRKEIYLFAVVWTCDFTVTCEHVFEK